jgi:hypothetical protein
METPTRWYLLIKKPLKNVTIKGEPAGGMFDIEYLFIDFHCCAYPCLDRAMVERLLKVDLSRRTFTNIKKLYVHVLLVLWLKL